MMVVVVMDGISQAQKIVFFQEHISDDLWLEGI